MATLILTAVGTAIGGPIGGAIGGLLGRAVDQAVLLKPRGREGPRLAELQVQTSTYGTQVPQIFGSMRVAGTVIWATDLRETKDKAGGGKGQPSVTTYAYSASFAVALSARAALGVGRIWADGNLLRGAAGDFKSEVGAFRFHPGSEDQPADPLIAAAQGIALTPAHRSVAYAVFEALALADYGNRIPSLTFELLADEGAVTGDGIVGALTRGAIAGDGTAAILGYAASGADVRAAIQPLADSHGWRLRTDGAGGMALDGGTTEVEGSIGRAGLAARINGRDRAPSRRSRAPAETVPLRLALRHYDPERDYQAGVQKAVRPGPGLREASVDLPAAISASRAKALAQERLAAAWAGRGTMALCCGWEALTHRPGSMVTVADVAGRWRVEEAEWEAMGVRLSLSAAPGAGPAALPAASGDGVRQPDLPHGPTSLRIVDLPVLTDAPPAAPAVFAAAAGVSPGWRRAALFTMDPAGGIATAMGQTAPEAVMGVVVTPPGAGCALLFDATASLEVELLNEDMALAPADDAALLRGANICLVGGELIQFGAAAQTGPRSFRLGRLLRGRRGTEWAMAGHGAGEPFLLIEAERLAPVPAERAQAGHALAMMAIGIGDATPAEAERIVTGEALIPPAPVHLRAQADGAGGWTVGWTRRSRAGWRWSDGVDAPLGEEQERYALRLLDGSAEVRVVETAAAEWTYGAAMAAEDAAAGHDGPLTVEIRQIGTHAAGRPAMLLLS